MLVSPVIKRLSQRYPRIVFHLVTAEETDTLYHELSERTIDLLIARRADLFVDEKLGFELLYDSSFRVVAGSRSPWLRRHRITLSDLVTEAWALPPPESVLGPTYLEVFRASGVDYPRPAVFAALAGVRLDLVATGRNVGNAIRPVVAGPRVKGVGHHQDVRRHLRMHVAIDADHAGFGHGDAARIALMIAAEVERAARRQREHVVKAGIVVRKIERQCAIVAVLLEGEGK